MLHFSEMYTGKRVGEGAVKQSSVLYKLSLACLVIMS